MTTFVFLGPSLSLNAAQQILPDARFMPPALMGDVYAAVVDGQARTIALIDGGFDHSPAVWHKEILHALDAGVSVFGASSMGALRAAELADFGMRGVGGVYDAYRSGTVQDDDEVAVMHGPAAVGYACTSQAMVSLRYGLTSAEAQGLITPDERSRIEHGLKALYYPERTWLALADIARAAGLPPQREQGLSNWMRDEARDLKRRDAVELLSLLAQAPPAVSSVEPPRLEKSAIWRAFERHRLVQPFRPEQGRVSTQAAHLRVVHGASSEHLRNAALWMLLEREGRRRPRAYSPGDRAARITRKRRQEGLMTPQATEAWLVARGLSPSDLNRWAALDDGLARLQASATEDFLEALHFELRRNPVKVDYPEPGPLPDLESVTRALQWYEQTLRTIGGPIEDHARDLGFDGVGGFLSAVADHHRATVSASLPSVQARDLVEGLN